MVERQTAEWSDDKNGFLITRTIYGSGLPPILYFIPHSALPQFLLDPSIPNSNISDAMDILNDTSPSESHEVILHGVFTKPLKERLCVEKFEKEFDVHCCALDLDKLRAVLGIVDEVTE